MYRGILQIKQYLKIYVEFDKIGSIILYKYYISIKNIYCPIKEFKGSLKGKIDLNEREKMIDL